MSDQSVHRREAARDFLKTRRAKITPDQVSLPVHGSRRVAGLRREEVALLAGVSVDYYTRLEKGNLSGASDSVLDAVAHALRLDEAERAYLFDLARAANGHRERPAASRARSVRAGVQRMLDAMTDAPAIVCNGRLDLVGANALGRALYVPVYESPVRRSVAAPPNMARFAFLDPAALELFVDHDAMAAMTVQLLRAQVGRTPRDKALSDLIGELSTRSTEFPRWWAAHDVRRHRAGAKSFVHPLVGELALEYESMDLQADPGLVMTVYTAVPGTPSSDALRLLASWAATREQAGRAEIAVDASS